MIDNFYTTINSPKMAAIDCEQVMYVYMIGLYIIVCVVLVIS